MWQPYTSSKKKCMKDTNSKIVFDKFHLTSSPSQANGSPCFIDNALIFISEDLTLYPAILFRWFIRLQIPHALRYMIGFTFCYSDLLSQLSQGASHFKGCWRNLHGLEFSSARRYSVPHAKPYDFTDAGMHEAICDPTYFTSVCQQTS